jgi:hypothetical protein
MPAIHILDPNADENTVKISEILMSIIGPINEALPELGIGVFVTIPADEPSALYIGNITRDRMVKVLKAWIERQEKTFASKN